MNDTIEELESDVMRDIEENPYKIYSVTFPYQVRFTLEDDDHNTEVIINTSKEENDQNKTEVIINTKSEEFYTATNEQEVLYQKELSDKYSEDAFKKRIIKYVRNQLYDVNPEEASLTFTGQSEVSKMTEEQLSTFKRELTDSGDE